MMSVYATLNVYLTAQQILIHSITQMKP